MKKDIEKKITIEYYKVTGLKKYLDGYEEDILDISDMLGRISNMDLNKRIINYAGEKLILKEIYFEDGLWILTFYKTTNSVVPLITDNTGNITKNIDLSEEENITQPLCLIYDPYKRVIAMQRNVFAVGTKGIEEFFNSFEYDGAIMLRNMVLADNKKVYCDNSNVKKISFIVHKNTKTNKFIKPKLRDTNLCKMIDNAMDFGGTIVNIDISMGNKKELLNMQKKDFEYIDELINNSDVKKFEIGTVSDEEVTMQTTDLVNCRIRDVVKITFSKGQTIPLNMLIDEMKNKIKTNKNI